MDTYCSVPESATKLNGLQEHRLCLLESEVVAQTEADAHGTEARNGDLDVSKLLCLDHFDLFVKLWDRVCVTQLRIFYGVDRYGRYLALLYRSAGWRWILVALMLCVFAPANLDSALMSARILPSILAISIAFQ